MMSSKRVVVTGIGIVAPNGLNREKFFETICAGESGLKKRNLQEIVGIEDSIVVGEAHLNSMINKDYQEEEKSILMAYQAIDEAISDSQIDKKQISKQGMRCGLSISTTVSGDKDTMQYISKKVKQEKTQPEWLIEHNSYTRKIAKYVGIQGPTFTTVSACAAGTAGATTAIDLMRAGVVDRVIVVGMDMLAEISIAGFKSLNSISNLGCAPFSKNRDGTSLGEGAAAFIIEDFDQAIERGVHIYGELKGYGLGNDAFHITSPSSEGANRTMRMALSDSRVDKWRMDYINAHGTATKLNDPTELEAISKLYDNKKTNVMISSSKGAIGHCLGAAGSLELAITLLAVDRGVVPPTARLEIAGEGFDEFNLVSNGAVKKDINYAMSNSFAFSGNSASIVVAKI